MGSRIVSDVTSSMVINDSNIGGHILPMEYQTYDNVVFKCKANYDFVDNFQDFDIEELD